jgi:hypothetical protein
MVETNLNLTCKACGQHFETKSDLQDHEKICNAERGVSGTAEKRRRSGKQNQISVQQGANEKSFSAGGDSTYRGDSDL